MTRFADGTVHLYPSRAKWIVIAFACAVFALAGCAMLQDPEVLREPDTVIGAWLCIGLFGPGFLFCILYMLPGASMLILNRDGFECRSVYRAYAYRWRDVSDFAVWERYRNEFVVFDDASKAGALSDMNRSLSGRNASLPDTYGMSAADLAGLMERWKAACST
jgi:hypothetical protein